MIPLTTPKSNYEEDYHQHKFYDEDGAHLATIEFDDIDEEGSGKLFCEIAVWCHIGHTDSRPLIAFERVNLLNRGAARGWLMSTVSKLGDVGALNWEQGLDFAVHESIVAYRSTSSEGGWLETGDMETGDPYLLRPFIASTGVSLLYGSHGSNKSMLALQWAIGIATGKGFNSVKPLKTGPVLYVDFEDSPEPHQFRLSAIAEALDMKEAEVQRLIWHERVKGNLKDAKRRLRRLVRDEGFALVIIDSIGLARAADVSGSEATIKLFKMFNQLGASILALDHMTKEDNKRVSTGRMDYREATPIGSQFTQSSARLAWFISILPQSTPKQKKANLYNTKHNHTPQHSPVGLTINLDWNDKDILTKVEFLTQEDAFEALVADAMKMTKAQELLVWHFGQQHDPENLKVMPMTLTEMKKSGINASTIRGIVTEKEGSARWWEQLKGSKQYILTPEGLETAHFVRQLYDHISGTQSGDDDA